jgi:hypothetical protein
MQPTVVNGSALFLDAEIMQLGGRTVGASLEGLMSHLLNSAAVP